MRSSREQFGKVRDRFRFEAAKFARLPSQLSKTIHPATFLGAFLCTLLSDSGRPGRAVSTANHAIKSYFLLQEKSDILSCRLCGFHMRQAIEIKAKYRIRGVEEDGRFRRATLWTSEAAPLSIPRSTG